MARIYGYPDSETRFLDKLPKEVESIDDIHEVHKEMKRKQLVDGHKKIMAQKMRQNRSKITFD